LDIPLDVQGALIDEQSLLGARLPNVSTTMGTATISRVVTQLQKAKRPVLVAGHGIRIAQAQKQLLKLVRLLNIPVVTTFNGFDLIATSANNFIGRIGTLGSRAGNFALQNADLVICLGTRNNIRQVSYNWASFARHAKKIIVDIDASELKKKTVKGDILVHGDAKVFIAELIKRIPQGFSLDPAWLQWCLARKKKYPVVLEEYKIPCKNCVHPYFFIETLTTALDNDAIVVAGNGTACVALFQAGVVKEKQRIFWNSGCAAMGYDLPAAMGAALAANREVVCITGDGSLQMNLQELQTFRHHALPVKIFILNNQGYRSIEQTQDAFFNSDFIGCNDGSGVSFPDNSKLADLYDLKYFRIDSTVKMKQVIRRVLSYGKAAICEVILDRNYIFSPKLSSEKKPDGRIVSKPLEDMYPFLARDEFYSNMLIKDM